MWPFKHKSEFSNLSSVHAIMLLTMALTLFCSLIVLVKVKMLVKEEAKTQAAVMQMQANMGQLGARRPPILDRMMPPRPPNQPGSPTPSGAAAAPVLPTTPPAPAPKK
jgi:hypothetical protein